MELDEKIDSISDATVVAEFTNMLNQAHVNISWWGQRLVSINGYEGEVEINKLAKKYIDSVYYQREYDTTLQSRLDCANLWEKVEKLYIDSDNQLKGTLIYHRIVPLLEYRPYCRACAGDPQALIRGREYLDKEEIFAFSPQRFKDHWSESPKLRSSYGFNSDGTPNVKWYASKEMVESALARQR